MKKILFIQKHYVPSISYQALVFLILLSLSISLVVPKAFAQDGFAPEEPRQSSGGRYQIESATPPTNSAGIAWANPDGPHSTYPWFMTWNQMGHLLESYQNYGSSASSAYFHHGIDVVTNNYGVNVYAVSGGQVVNIENYNSGSLYWEVAILDAEGYVWQFHHINYNSIPTEIHNAYNAWKADPVNGGFIPAGTLIGQNVQWPTYTFGYYFHHVHLNILADNDVYINPLEFFTPSYDTQPPVIEAIGLLKNNSVTTGTTVSGDYGLYVKAYDLYQSSVYDLPPYKTEFSIDGGPWTTVWEFHTFPGGSNDYTYVNDFYVYPPTCGNYSCREFYIDLGFTTEGQRAFPTTLGDHNIQVRVSDQKGNSTTGSFTYTYYKTYEIILSSSISDNGCSTGSGVTRTFNVTDDIVISDINVGLNISHSTRGQIRVTLKAPGDTTATTIVSTGSDSYDNYDVLIDDASSNSLNDGSNDSTSTPYYDRTAGPVPDGSLDSFTGKSAKGTWTLFICDNTSGTTGTVNRVKIDITGAPGNRAPVANPQSVTLNEDTSANITLTGSDPNNDPLTFQVITPPENGTLSGTAPDLTYTPAPDFNGEDYFKFVVNDGKVDSAPATVSLTINPINDPPLAGNQTVYTVADTTLWIELFGSDVEGDALTFNILTGPMNGILGDLDQIPYLTYTPAAGFIGADSFTYQVTDGMATSAPATISITVVDPVHRPVANAQSLTLVEDTSIAFSLTGSDPDGDPITFSVLIIPDVPAHGDLSGTPPDLVYTPFENFSGTDSFMFVTNDGQVNSLPATVAITVTPVNDIPIAYSQEVSVYQGSSVAITLQGYDVENYYVYNYSIISGPSHGSLSGYAPYLTYNPDLGYSGADSFTFIVNDGEINSAPAVVSITVIPSGPMTVFSDDFETDRGWIRNPNGTDTATTGLWERADPETTSYDGIKQMGTTTSGTYDLVTGPLAGSSAGDYDIDGGATTIRSPNITLPAGKTLTLSLRYYLAHANNSSSADYLRVKIVGATTTTVLNEVGAANDDDAAWASLNVDISSYAGQTVYILIEAADASSASLVEAGIDDVLIIAQ